MCVDLSVILEYMYCVPLAYETYSGLPTETMAWSRLADYTQRTFSVLLLGLTIYGGVVLANGGYSVVQRRKKRKALEDIAEKAKGSEWQHNVRRGVCTKQLCYCSYGHKGFIHKKFFCFFCPTDFWS